MWTGLEKQKFVSVKGLYTSWQEALCTLYSGTTWDQGVVIQSVCVDTGNMLIYMRPEDSGYNPDGYPSGGSQKLGG